MGRQEMETLEAYFIGQRHCERVYVHFTRFSEVLGKYGSRSGWQDTAGRQGITVGDIFRVERWTCTAAVWDGIEGLSLGKVIVEVGYGEYTLIDMV